LISLRFLATLRMLLVLLEQRGAHLQLAAPLCIPTGSNEGLSSVPEVVAQVVF